MSICNPVAYPGAAPRALVTHISDVAYEVLPAFDPRTVNPVVFLW